jgi:hypothetical protein
MAQAALMGAMAAGLAQAGMDPGTAAQKAQLVNELTCVPDHLKITWGIRKALELAVEGHVVPEFIDQNQNKYSPYHMWSAMRGAAWVTDDEYRAGVNMLHLLEKGDFKKKDGPATRGCTYKELWEGWYNELRKGVCGPQPAAANATAAFVELVTTNVPLALGMTLDLAKNMEKAKVEMRAEMDRFKDQLQKQAREQMRTEFKQNNEGQPPAKKQKREEDMVCEKWVLADKTGNPCEDKTCRRKHTVDSGLLDYLSSDKGRKWGLSAEEKKAVLDRC